jgi:hypothetical protein
MAVILNVLGYWPGHQAVPLAFERLTEFLDDEYCGCDRQEDRYADCCKAKDQTSAIGSFVRLYCELGGTVTRIPSRSIFEFAHRPGSPPDIEKLLGSAPERPRRLKPACPLKPKTSAD